MGFERFNQDATAFGVKIVHSKGEFAKIVTSTGKIVIKRTTQVRFVPTILSQGGLMIPAASHLGEQNPFVSIVGELLFYQKYFFERSVSSGQ